MQRSIWELDVHLRARRADLVDDAAQRMRGAERGGEVRRAAAPLTHLRCDLGFVLIRAGAALVGHDAAPLRRSPAGQAATTGRPGS